MIISYLRSSSLGTLEMCEMKYFFQYVLGMKDKTNKKAVLGTIVHRTMQVLADKKKAQLDKKKLVENDDIPNLNFFQCDDIEYITRICFDYYKKHEEDVGLDEKDYKTCVQWVNKALEYSNGSLDPRNQNVYATELFFDIEIKKPWAKYTYNINGKKISGNLAIKGTVDLIIKEDDVYYQVLDYKTGKRLNWATGKEKTYEDLCSDKQLMLYFYALKNMYQYYNFYTSIYYINDGGVFDIVFSEEDYHKAEEMLRKRFEYIKSVELPRQLSNDQLNWKCTKLCKFAEQYPGSNKTTCQHFYDLIRLKGMSTVVSEHADLNKFGQYGAGGGKLDNA
jgi:CRISPR/Cas system-associated exonuclease Cas4 (RecB family)